MKKEEYTARFGKYGPATIQDRESTGNPNLPRFLRPRKKSLGRKVLECVLLTGAVLGSMWGAYELYELGRRRNAKARGDYVEELPELNPRIVPIEEFEEIYPKPESETPKTPVIVPKKRNEAPKRTDTLVQAPKTEYKKVELVAPVFQGLRANHCAEYVRRAAKRITDAKYNPADAWDFSKVNQLVSKVDGNISNHEDKLKPGISVVSFYYPKSRYNSPDREVTHVALYLGKDKNGSLVFAENAGRYQRTITYGGLKRRGYSPREIIEPKSNEDSRR